MHKCTVHRGKVNKCGYCSWTVAALLPETRENKKKKKGKKNENAELQNANTNTIIFIQTGT